MELGDGDDVFCVFVSNELFRAPRRSMLYGAHVAEG